MKGDIGPISSSESALKLTCGNVWGAQKRAKKCVRLRRAFSRAWTIFPVNRTCICSYKTNVSCAISGGIIPPRAKFFLGSLRSPYLSPLLKLNRRPCTECVVYKIVRRLQDSRADIQGSTYGIAPEYLGSVVRVADLPVPGQCRFFALLLVLLTVCWWHLSTFNNRYSRFFHLAGPHIWNSLPWKILHQHRRCRCQPNAKDKKLTFSGNYFHVVLWIYICVVLYI